MSEDINVVKVWKEAMKNRKSNEILEYVKAQVAKADKEIEKCREGVVDCYSTAHKLHKIINEIHTYVAAKVREDEQGK